MKLRVPDYYSEFSCIADKCKDSCCIGWEIDIDEDTHDYYRQIEGAFGERLRENMYITEDGDYSFRLKEHGRCPFLNSKNLCDICIELGEEALSEVCTEYPRFAIEYEDVLQKCLSLSCEEVGRILFTRENPVKYVEMELQEDGYFFETCEHDENFYENKIEVVEHIGNGCETECESYEENGAAYKQCGEKCDVECEQKLEEIYDTDDYAVLPDFMEKVQDSMFQILEDRSKSIWDRMQDYLSFAQIVQEAINKGDEPGLIEDYKTQALNQEKKLSDYSSWNNFAGFSARFSIFEDMETLDAEWNNAKREIRETLTEDSYSDKLQDFMESGDMLEKDYEHLMTYFTFRYMLNSVYDSNVISYARLAVLFTLMIRDMDVVRYRLNGKHYALSDRIDVARIFSKEVEHSEDNVEYAREEIMFEN